MKQYITPAQWNELTRAQKIQFWDGHALNELPNIGQMIAFLGKSWIERIIYIDDPEKLCDALWQSCKKRLTSRPHKK